MGRHSRIEEERPSVAATPHLIAAREELTKIKSTVLWQTNAAGFKLKLYCEGHSLWAIIEWPNGGRLCARPVYAPAGDLAVIDVSKDKSALRLSLKCPIGIFHLRIELPDPRRPLLHWQTSLVPTENLTISDWPCDL